MYHLRTQVCIRHLHTKPNRVRTRTARALTSRQLIAEHSVPSWPSHPPWDDFAAKETPKPSRHIAIRRAVKRGRLATTDGEECRVRISAGRQATPKEPLRAVHTEGDEEGIRRATHRHTLSLAPNSITLLRAQRLSHQGVASQHEKPNEGAGFFFLSLYFEGLFCTLSESLSGTSRPLMAFEETR